MKSSWPLLHKRPAALHHLKDTDEEQLASYVEEIKEINNISQEGMIYAGRYLVLPIYEKIESI